MKWVAMIPWRGGDPARERSCQWVGFYLTNEAGVPNWSLVDSNPDLPFSRADAKNRAAEQASREGFDVVVFHDADMIIPPGCYLEAVELAWRSGGLVVAFSEYRALGQSTSFKVLTGKLNPWDAPDVGRLNAWSLGGIVAVRLDRFNEVGGFDTRFRGWGCEDWAFAIAWATVTGVATNRTNNPGIHLWHPHGAYNANSKDLEFNNKLLTRYQGIRNVDDLRAVQSIDVDA